MNLDEKLYEELEVVKKVALELGIELHSCEKARYGRGNSNYILTLTDNTKFVLRLMKNRSFWYTEQEVLKLVKDFLPVATIEQKGKTNSYFWLMLTYLEGFNMSEALAFCPEIIFYETGRMLGLLHECLFEDYGKWTAEGFVKFEGPWITHLEALFDQEVRYLSERKIVSPQLLFKVRLLFEKYKVLAHFDERPTLIHRDFKPENILITRTTESWRITGVLDFEHAQVGEVVWDFARVFNRFFLPAPKSRISFLAGYSSARCLPLFEESHHLCQLIDSLGCIRWGHQHKDDSFIAEHVTILEDLGST